MRPGKILLKKRYEMDALIPLALGNAALLIKEKYRESSELKSLKFEVIVHLPDEDPVFYIEVEVKGNLLEKA